VIESKNNKPKLNQLLFTIDDSHLKQLLNLEEITVYATKNNRLRKLPTHQHKLISNNNNNNSIFYNNNKLNNFNDTTNPTNTFLPLDKLNNHLKCFYTNATSLNNKMNHLRSYISAGEFDVLFISETWFKEDSCPNLNGYSIYKKDRNDQRHGGGVCIYIKNTFSTYEVSWSD